MLVLGELVPKRIAMKKAEPISMFVIRPLNVLSSATLPFVKFLSASTNFFVRLFGVDPSSEDENVTEEEIRMMIDVGEERGTIHKTEKVMINNIFEFDNKTAADIMTHRTDIVGISVNTSYNQTYEILKNERYSRFPVFEGNIDSIVGMLHIKDFIQDNDALSDKDFNLLNILRIPYFVPGSKKTDQLFKEMQRNKTHIAVVIDEYGGTAGIVTMEDLLEEIVGNIFDEYDEEVKEIEKIDDNTFLLNGTVNLDLVEDYFDIELPIEKYYTLSGFIIGEIGRIPKEDEHPEIKSNGLIFKVKDVKEKRVSKVEIYKEK